MMKEPKQSLKGLAILLLSFSVFLAACGDEEPENPSLTLLSITANGTPLVDGTINVATEVTFELVFSSALEASRFVPAFSLSSSSGPVTDLTISYTNAASKAVISTTLENSTDYQLRVSAGMLGQNDGILAQAIERNFTTRDDGTITELAPCISASSDCLGSLPISDGAGSQGNFQFYSSFPLDLNNARWENLTSAVIVLHGLNRDADNYFSYMMSSLRAEDLEEQTLLLAPYFKDASAAQTGELYWNDSGWREGQASDSPTSISSFAVLDQLLDVLGDQARFPVLETIVIAGHSSGALFAHAYAAASDRADQLSAIDFRFVVANSQYFYYPLDVRYDADSGTFTPVSGCSAFNHWPLGFVNPPSYLDGISKATVDERITTRQVTYLLGNQDVVTTGTLNTSDCEAVVLGENRFRRGENIFRLLETNFATTQQSEKVVVDGVGHNGQNMFQSTEFVNWLRAVLL